MDFYKLTVWVGSVAIIIEVILMVFSCHPAFQFSKQKKCCSRVNGNAQSFFFSFFQTT